MGCADPGATRAQSDPLKGLRAAERAAVNPQQPAMPERGQIREQPAALANGLSLSWDELRPMLAEAAGGQVVQEALLDRLLVTECKGKGISIGQGDVDAERKLLTEAIVRDAKATPNDAERLLESVRRSRGLGEVRFARLLERNARMRKLVAPTVEVSDADVAQAFEILHGVKYRVRVILTSEQSGVADALEKIAGSTGSLSVPFAERAMSISIDPSAERGGLLDPFSDADPAYPSSVREAVRGLQVGQVSPVLAVDRGYAIVLLEGRIPADGVRIEDALGTIAAEVRTRRERAAMDALGLRLIRGSGLRVLDRSLDWSLSAARAPVQP